MLKKNPHKMARVFLDLMLRSWDDLIIIIF